MEKLSFYGDVMIYVYCLEALVAVLAVSMLVPVVNKRFHGWRKRSKQSQETFASLFGHAPDSSNQSSVRQVSLVLRSSWDAWMREKGSRNVFRVRRISCEFRDKVAAARREGYILPTYILTAIPELTRVLDRIAYVRDPQVSHLVSDEEQVIIHRTAHRA